MIVCCGSGGVGKTTVSATSRWRRPEQVGAPAWSPSTRPGGWPTRSGVQSLPNTPDRGRRVTGPDTSTRSCSTRRGPSTTWCSATPAPPIRPSRSWPTGCTRTLPAALSGTQEYMAMEKLYELVHSKEFDVVVVDTPPTRNALDLLDAPRRLTRFLENRLFRALLVPTRMWAAGRGRRHPGAAAHDRPGGRRRDRAGRGGVLPGLRGDGGRVPQPGERRPRAPRPTRPPPTSWSPRHGPTPSTEAGFFAEKLAERDVAVAALVVNRIAPSFGNGDDGRRPERAGRWALEANLAELNTGGGARGAGLRRSGGAGVARRPSAGSRSSGRTCTSSTACAGRRTTVRLTSDAADSPLVWPSREAPAPG